MLPERGCFESGDVLSQGMFRVRGCFVIGMFRVRGMFYDRGCIVSENDMGCFLIGDVS